MASDDASAGMEFAADSPDTTPKRGTPVEVNASIFTYPDPITLWVGFLGPRNWRETNFTQIRDMMNQQSAMMNRQPSQTEADALAEYVSRQLYISRLGYPLSIAGFLALSYRSGARRGLVPRNIMQALRNPRVIVAGFNNHRLGHPGGPWAALQRPGIVLLFCMFGIQPIVSILGTVSQGKAAVRDPRLKDYNRDLQQSHDMNVQRRREAVQARAQGMRGQQQPAGQQGLGQGQQSHDDDQSLGGAMASADWSYSSGLSSYQEQDMGGYEPARPQRQPQSGYKTPDTGYSQSYGGYSQDTSRSSSDSGDFFDDASPIAPEPNQQDNRAPASGSAWDRLRQQNASSGRIEPMRRPGPSPPGDASSAYGSDRMPEREQAQRDFNKLLDAERNMGGDSRNGGRGSGGSF